MLILIHAKWLYCVRLQTRLQLSRAYKCTYTCLSADVCKMKCLRTHARTCIDMYTCAHVHRRQHTHDERSLMFMSYVESACAPVQCVYERPLMCMSYSWKSILSRSVSFFNFFFWGQPHAATELDGNENKKSLPLVSATNPVSNDGLCVELWACPSIVHCFPIQR